MPPPLLKPETQRTLKVALLALAPLLAAAEELVALRTRERDQARERLTRVQFELDVLVAQRKAIRQDLGDEP